MSTYADRLGSRHREAGEGTDAAFSMNLNGARVTFKNTSFASDGVSMVGQRMTMDQYIAKKFTPSLTYTAQENSDRHSGISKRGKNVRDQLIQIEKNYGEYIHEIQGDGNCLATSFAVSLMYCMIENRQLIETFVHVITSTLSEHDKLQLEQQIQEVIGPLYDLQSGTYNSSNWIDTQLSNGSYMKSFSRILRILASELMDRELGLKEAIPEMQMEDGTDIGVDAIQILSRHLKLTAHVINLQNDQSNYNVFKPDDNTIPDVVIIRKDAHFLSLVPDPIRIESHLGLRRRMDSSSAASSSSSSSAPRSEEMLNVSAAGLRRLRESVVSASAETREGLGDKREDRLGEKELEEFLLRTQASTAPTVARQRRGSCIRILPMVALPIILAIGVYLRSFTQSI